MFSKRAFVTALVVAFVAGLIASLALRSTVGPAVVASHSSEGVARRIHWRVPLSTAQNLPGSGETIVWLAENVAAASGGTIHLDLFDPGEIVPAFAITDAVRDGKVQAGITWLGYDQGKIPSSALFGATPFGLDPPGYISWWFFGGGRELADEVYGEHNVKPLFCMITGPETAGWFSTPIESSADLKGLKIRFAGVGGKVMQRLGASITMLPSGDIFQALETGVIDATEFSQPITDKALGFSRIAKYNYFPGWHQPFSASHLIVNIDVWNALASADQVFLESMCTATVARQYGLSESLQGPIIREYRDSGVEARYLPREMLLELKRTADEVLNEEAENDEYFKRVLASQRDFKAMYGEWKSLAYLPSDL
jgi:TRAP-type mannitol/chloroaromatic compound transport system substrate-binding protein